MSMEELANRQIKRLKEENETLKSRLEEVKNELLECGKYASEQYKAYEEQIKELKSFLAQSTKRDHE